jgi:hypothetical protein
MLAVEEVSLDFDSVVCGNRRLGDIPGDYEPWQEEHGPAIFAGPVTGFELEFGEEGEAIRGGFEGGFGGLELGKVLEMRMSAVISSHMVCAMVWTYGAQVQKVLVCLALGPCFNFLVCLQVMPCLTAPHILQSPSGVVRLLVSSFCALHRDLAVRLLHVYAALRRAVRCAIGWWHRFEGYWMFLKESSRSITA